MGLKAAVLILAILLLWTLRENAGAVAVAAIREQAADSMYVVALENKHESTVRLRELAEEVVRLARQKNEEVAIADRAAARRPAIVTRIVEVAGDSSAVVAAVADLEEAQAQEVSALRLALAQADSIITAERSRTETVLRLNKSLELALEASRAEARAWERASKPRLFGIHVTPGTTLVVGTLVGAGVVLFSRR